MGSGVVNDDGTFTIVTSGPRLPMSEVQGQALIDVESDAILQRALEVLQGGLAAHN
jgi:hypothetical protein